MRKSFKGEKQHLKEEMHCRKAKGERRCFVVIAEKR